MKGLEGPLCILSTEGKKKKTCYVLSNTLLILLCSCQHPYQCGGYFDHSISIH